MSDEAGGRTGGHDPRLVGHHRADRRIRVKRKSMPWWLETVLLLCLALALALGIKTFFVQSFYVPSPSMEPTLIGESGGIQDRILVQKVSYWGPGSVERGDVVVFEDPGGWLAAEQTTTASGPVEKTLSFVGLYPTSGHLVKRVIGVGGDHVVCCDEQGRLSVNGTALDEPFVQQPDATDGKAFDVTVPTGDLWVMGDNRGNSEDSRYHTDDAGGGFVPESAVVGKVSLVVWPWSDRKVLRRPAAFADLPDPDSVGG